MIQRIQSIWLLFAALCFGLGLLPGINLMSSSQVSTGIFNDQILQSMENGLTMAGNIGSSSLAFIAIFLFNTRGVQMILAGLSSLLHIVLSVGGSIYLASQEGVLNFLKPEVGILGGVLGIILIWLATRAIGKDEAKVRSMDRLR
ncbi:MAG: DUF4293 domain-containing protein [Bacteroidota bacterium]|nr:DUF4293 domain-containing protein [Bacteroidota bacterium]